MLGNQSLNPQPTAALHSANAKCFSPIHQGEGLPPKAYPSASGDTKYGTGGVKFVLEQITNITTVRRPP
jgi:hypothetical protein